MEPSKHSIIGMYGNEELFRKKLDEGYTIVAFGTGPSRNDTLSTIVGMWAFFSPDREKIATLKHPNAKYMLETGRQNPFEEIYTRREFFDYVRENKIAIGEKVNLADLIKEEYSN